MLPQLRQQHLQANLAQAQVFLQEAIAEDDPIGQNQFAQLVSKLGEELSAIATMIEHAPAGVALFFGGRPVYGSTGIQSEFSSKVLAQFQKLVSQRYAADQTGPLQVKGPLPLKGNSHMLVTDIVRGSFGFVLQQATSDKFEGDQDNQLHEILDKVAGTLSGMAAQDDGLFTQAASEIDDRQKTSFSEFFKFLDVEGATVRIVEGNRDFELDLTAIARARNRVESLQICDRQENKTGKVVGWLDASAKFEIQLDDTNQVIQGNIDRAELNRVASNGIEPYHKRVQAQLNVREVSANNRSPKLTYTLNRIELVEAFKAS
jgi:hypothetical protein